MITNDIGPVGIEVEELNPGDAGFADAMDLFASRGIEVGQPVPMYVRSVFSAGPGVESHPRARYSSEYSDDIWRGAR